MEKRGWGGSGARSRGVLLVVLTAVILSSCAAPGTTRREPSEPGPREPVTRTVEGYRIQIATTNDRAEADSAVEAASAWYRSMSPGERPAYLGDGNLDVEVAWKAPYYRVQVGRFATRSEGQRALDVVARRFPGSFLVPSLVTVTR